MSLHLIDVRSLSVGTQLIPSPNDSARRTETSSIPARSDPPTRATLSTPAAEPAASPPLPARIQEVGRFQKSSNMEREDAVAHP
jgi:hypothetical protein